MKRSIKYGVNLKKKFFIWRDPVQFHYVDLPCYMYYGFESALGISIEMMIVMYKYKQFIKENAPAFDMRSKYHDAQLTKEQLENVEMEAIREMELEELQDMVEIPNYYEMFAQARRELNGDYIKKKYFYLAYYHEKDIQGSCGGNNATGERAEEGGGNKGGDETSGSSE